MSHDHNEAPGRAPVPGDPPVSPSAVPTTFDQVLTAELALIQSRRREVEGAEDESFEEFSPPGADVDKRTMEARVGALDEHVTGLSFSGGGIRAATFAVGVLQGMATLGLLKRFDYLSTVSGGGYAGAWIAAWLKRDGRPANVEAQLNPNRVAESRASRAYLVEQVVDEEPEPIRHLRSFSSYLSPRPGLMAVDTWTVIMIWVRNVTINMMMLLPAVMMLVVAARLVVYFYGLFNTTWQGDDPRQWLIILPFLVIGAVCLRRAFVRNGEALAEFRTRDTGARRSTGAGDVDDAVNKGIVYPALVAVVCLTVSLRWVLARLATWFDRPPSELIVSFREWLWRIGVVGERPVAAGFSADPNGPWRLPWDYLRSHLGPADVPNFVLHALIIGGFIAVGSLGLARRDRAPVPWKFVRAAFMAGATGGVLLVLLEGLTAWFSGIDRPDLMATFVPPLAMLILVAGLIVEVALLGRVIGEGEREWWARVSAMLTLVALGWLGVMATILYVPGLILSVGPTLRAAIASGWIGSAAFGVITGR